MTIKYIFLAIIVVAGLSIFSLSDPQEAYAANPCEYETNASGACYGLDWPNGPPSLGCYIDCVFEDFIKWLSYIIIVVAIILASWAILKTVLALRKGDSQNLQEVSTNWGYIILLTVLVVGLGTVFINSFLKIMGAQEVPYYYAVFQAFIDWIK